MYPAPFNYHRPGSLSEAIALLAELGEGAKPLAGGQTLIPILKLRMDEPSDLVDIARLPDLHYMDNANGDVRIGALATHARVGRSELAQAVPVLGDCANGIADAQVRARGTIGGSVSAADPSCDWPTLLHVLDAEIVCQGRGGTRALPIREFIRGSYTTALEADELVTEIRFKKPPGNSGGAYIGFKKAAPAYPAAAAGVQLTLAEGNVCQDVRLVLGAAGIVALAISLQAIVFFELDTASAVWPTVIGLLGVGSIFSASQIARPRGWAAFAGMACALLASLAIGSWALLLVAHGVFGALGYAGVFVNMGALLVIGLALSDVRKAQAARKRLRERGMTLGL